MESADVPGGDEEKSEEMLYRELKQILPTAILSTYVKDGAWSREVLLLDIELVKAHRHEAGAPEPPPLDENEELEEIAEVRLVKKGPKVRPWKKDSKEAPAQEDKGTWPREKLPQQQEMVRGVKRPAPPSRLPLRGPPLKRQAFEAPSEPRAPYPITHPNRRLTPTEPSMPPPGRSMPPPPGVWSRSAVATPRGAPSAASSIGRASEANGAGSSIQDFVGKWNLEETRTKLLLSRLAPMDRVRVMNQFRHSSAALSATAQLEAHVRSHERGVSRPLPTPTAPSMSGRAASAPAFCRPVVRSAPPPVVARAVVAGVPRSSAYSAIGARTASAPPQRPAFAAPVRSASAGTGFASGYSVPVARVGSSRPQPPRFAPPQPHGVPAPNTPPRSARPLTPERPPPARAMSYPTKIAPSGMPQRAPATPRPPVTPRPNVAGLRVPNDRGIPQRPSSALPTVRRPAESFSEPPAKRARPLGSVGPLIGGMARPTPKAPSAAPPARPTLPRAAPTASRPGDLIRSLLSQ
ncbi:unnamed protein product [Polarella glacialis]|uniref:Uncharacterized protein n=1 Tax=Polarella glacialis TaxID=89957 RepID=A0A813DT87_POLGL|nr:unnamed protein product [Polarella glacialis]